MHRFVFRCPFLMFFAFLCSTSELWWLVAVPCIRSVFFLFVVISFVIAVFFCSFVRFSSCASLSPLTNGKYQRIEKRSEIRRDTHRNVYIWWQTSKCMNSVYTQAKKTTHMHKHMERRRKKMHKIFFSVYLLNMIFLLFSFVSFFGVRYQPSTVLFLSVCLCVSIVHNLSFFSRFSHFLCQFMLIPMHVGYRWICVVCFVPFRVHSACMRFCG